MKDSFPTAPLRVKLHLSAPKWKHALAAIRQLARDYGLKCQVISDKHFISETVYVEASGEDSAVEAFARQIQRVCG